MTAESELLPIVQAVDVMLAVAEHAKGHMDDEAMRDAVTLELAGVDDLEVMVRALGITGVAVITTLASALDGVTTIGALRHFKRVMLEDIYGPDEA